MKTQARELDPEVVRHLPRSHDAGFAPIREYQQQIRDSAQRRRADFGDGVWLRLWPRLSNNYFAVDGNLLLGICITRERERALLGQ